MPLPQTTYNQFASVAVAGMLYDGVLNTDKCAYPASEVIPFGRACEVVNGAVRLCQGTTQEVPNLIGVSIYKDAHYAGGYQIGEMVPLLRKGRIWVELAAGTTGAVELEGANVSHSSTIPTDRGKFTDAAANGTAGTEISSAVGKFRTSKATGATGLAVVELNLSASGSQ